MNEVWKPVVGAEGRYEVSNTGKVRSLSFRGCGNQKELHQYKDRGGYHAVWLYIDGDRRYRQVHRLVAMAFIQNPENKPQVNHKDGNKSNNHVGNLEWVTRLENARHAADTGLWDKQINKFRERNKEDRLPVVCVDVRTGSVTRYESTQEAMRAVGSRHVSDVAKGKQAQSKGYVFFYADEYKTMDKAALDEKMALGRASFNELGGRRKRPIQSINIATGETAIYETIEAAKRATGSNGVLQVLQGKYKQSKGYIFRYADE